MLSEFPGAEDIMTDLALIIIPYLNHYGYWAVFFVILLEDFGLPLPGETLLITAALLASNGNMNIFLLLFVAWSAAVIGDNIGYVLGRYGGRVFVLRYGHHIFITPNRIEYAENFFCRYGSIVVMTARFFEILRQLNGIVAGIARMSWWKFLTFNALGAMLWVGFWGTISYKIGQQIDVFENGFKNFKYIFLATFILTGIGIITHFLRKKWRRGKSGDEDKRINPPCKLSDLKHE
jgi:membrane protein DedA with SNARE-associated domain